MQIDIITKQDLEKFKIDLLQDLMEIIKPEPRKKWLTSKDVRELLKQYRQGKKMVKMMKGKGMDKMMKKIQGGQFKVK